jgi:uncharacterized glyoxalase superfamily protein PhnB
MQSNRSMPPCTIIPELAYASVGEAATFLCEAFGFRERLRIPNHRSQLCFGAGAIVVVEKPQRPPPSRSANFTPDPEPERRHSLLLRVDDVESHYERAKLKGAWIVHPPTDYPYGERQYTAEDPGGHRWTFSQTIADIAPEAWGGTPLE